MMLISSITTNGTDHHHHHAILTDEQWFLYISIVVGLVLLAGLMSGLTLGLMSMDVLDMEVGHVSLATGIEGSLPRSTIHRELNSPISASCFKRRKGPGDNILLFLGATKEWNQARAGVG